MGSAKAHFKMTVQQLNRTGAGDREVPRWDRATTRIAVLMTCFNRRALTLQSLRALLTQQHPTATLEVFLVDDGSTDGTAEAVAREFPSVRILGGTGNLFWNRGMYAAFAAARKEPFDYFLWLNDDTVLLPDAVDRLLACSEILRQGGTEAIVVGNTQDPVSGTPTYGGLVRSGRVSPVRFRLASAVDQLQTCDTLEGNCLLIPDRVASVVGNLDPAFQHNFGDVDYGLRARRAGHPIVAMPGFVGRCAANPLSGSWQDTSLPLSRRWTILMSPKGCPWNDWLHFTRRHGGIFWPIFAISPVVKTVLSSLFRGKLR